MTAQTDRLNTALDGRYRILRHLGEGGMASVYLCEDLKHERKVALKLLKPELAAVLGAERFVQEIKTTAALQHPHILPLFDSGAVDGFLYYVMPFIDGETLRAKLDRETQLGVEDAVRITRDVADALHYAHTRGIVHRDVKPENILLHDGRPMIADFGIALAVSAAAGGRMTETGLSLGTPHYMSPEQATAEKEITARSDVYSIGSVLYEMLTGNPPHTGANAQQIIMKIITVPAEPVTMYRKSVPANVAAAVAKSLEKLPADRFESAKAFAEALANSAFAHVGGTSLASGARADFPRSRRTTVLTGALMVLAIGAAAAAGWTLRHPPAQQVVRFPAPLSSGQQPSSAAELSIALSPDGSHLAYVALDSSTARNMLYLRALDQLTAATAIPGTEEATTPFFSPDGLWIGFVTANGDIKKVAVSGGPVSRIVTAAERGSTPSWGDDHRIVYHVAGVPTRIADGGGAPAPVVDSTNRELRGLGYFVLPGGRAMLWRQCGYRFLCDGDLAVLDLTSGTSTVLVSGASRGWYLPSGHLVYATREGALFAVTFDLASLKITSTPVAVLDGIQLIGRFSLPAVTVSASGSLAYVPGGPTMASNTIVQVDRTGREETIVSKPGAYQALRFSPDGRRLAFHDRDAKGGFQLSVHDFASATSQQLTFEGNNIRPVWSPDGRRLAFATQPAGAAFHIESIPSDGSGPGAREGPDMVGALTPSWTRDGQWIVFNGLSKDGRADGKTDIFAIPMSGATRTMRPAVAGPSQEGSGEVSPDGKWIAYVSDETGKGQVFVQPFLSPGPRTPISTGGSSEPVWLSNNALVYRDDDAERLTQARLAFGAAVTVTRTVLFDARPYVRGTGWGLWRNFDVSPDGTHFIMLKPQAGAQKVDPIVVLHWSDEVKRLMAAAGIK
jgi:Tol biopolymer transport system component